jgi:hypothetical protein
MGATMLRPKKGKTPSPHQSPGRAAGSGPTSTAGVKARPMGKSAGNGRSVKLRGAGVTKHNKR